MGRLLVLNKYIKQLFVFKSTITQNVLIIQLLAQMKAKQTFKNPFDLIEEEQEPMSMPTRNKYVPPASNVHAPLPFNPYQITKEQPKANNVKAVPMITPSHDPAPSPAQNSRGFVSPFGQETTQNVEQQYQNQPYEEEKPKEYELDENGDPPLLEDIGIEPEKIKERILLVLRFGQPSYDIIHNPDLSGPILIALALGCLLLFAGKLHFGDIYAMFILGTGLLYFLINFISQTQILPLYSIMSTLGYGMLPMLAIGFVGVFVSLKSGLGIGVALAAAAWSSFSAGNFMDVLIKDSKDKKMLIIYPLFLFYISFTMIVIF